MKGINRIQWCSVVLLAFSLTACKVKRPETVLPDAKMENVLYDYHIAKAMGEEVPYNESYKRVLYIESVFKKYGITQADFDSSMVWFARNPEVLTKIYEKVNVRLKAERDGINHLIALRDNKPKESLPGDSIDVWIWQHIYQLTGMPLDNKITFTLPSDTNFHDRDTLRWSARFRFHNGAPDSIHAPLMAMQVLYEKNDSVISAIRKVQGTGCGNAHLVCRYLRRNQGNTRVHLLPAAGDSTAFAGRPYLTDALSRHGQSGHCPKGQPSAGHRLPSQRQYRETREIEASENSGAGKCHNSQNHTSPSESMKRYASHFLFLPGHGYLKQYVVEIGEGQCVSRIFPLTEEVENTEWLPGVIALLTEAETDYPHFDTCCNILTAIPPVIEEELSCLIPWLFFPFDFTTMLPGAGTQRKLLL